MGRDMVFLQLSGAASCAVSEEVLVSVRLSFSRRVVKDLKNPCSLV